MWLREANGLHTRITLRNYFSLNYGIPKPEYRFRLHDRDGQCVASWRRVARPDETLVIESPELAARFCLDREFDGTLVVEVQHPKLDPPRFLRANVDYYSADGLITTVHEQGRLVLTPRQDAQSIVYVREDDEYETGVVLQNWYRYRRSPTEYLQRATIELLNSAGRQRIAEAPAVPAGASRFMRLADLFPEAAAFLGGGVGGLRIRSNIAIGRTIPVLRARKTGFIAVSHTVGDHDPTIYQRDFVPSSAGTEELWAPVWCSFVDESEATHTEFCIFNNWLPRNTYVVDIRVFDADGVLRAKIPGALRLHPDETGVLVMACVLASAGVVGPFRGMVEARLSPRGDQATMPGPGMLNVNTLWSAGGAVTQSTNQSLGHANSLSATPHFLSSKRTKMFGRVVSTRDYETMLSLMNPSSEERYATASDTEIVVCDASGGQRRSSALAIPPHGSVWISLDEVFPDLSQFLAETGGISSVLVRDQTVKLTGYLGVRHRRYGTIGIDHLFGG